MSDQVSRPHPTEGRRYVFFLPWLVMGGATKFNIDLIDELSAYGWEATVVSTLKATHDWLSDFSRRADVVLLDQEVTPRTAPHYLADLLHRTDPDILLVSMSEMAYILLPFLRNHAPRAAVVDICHSAAPDWLDGGYPRYSLNHRHHIDLSVVTSEDLKNWMVRRGRDPHDVEVCYTNIDTDLWRPNDTTRVRVRAALSVGPDTPLVLYSARLSKEKQPLLTLAIADRLRRDGQNFRLVIAGDGPLQNEVRREIARRDLEGTVRLEGQASLGRVRELMCASDIYLLPSKLEGLSMTLFEAMACGVSVVAADVGGHRELVTPETGILVGLGPAQEELERYTDALQTLIADDALRTSMGRNGRDRVVSGFRLSDMATRLAALLETARERVSSEPVPQPEVAAASRTAVRYLRLRWGIIARVRHLAWRIVNRAAHVVGRGRAD